MRSGDATKELQAIIEVAVEMEREMFERFGDEAPVLDFQQLQLRFRDSGRILIFDAESPTGRAESLD